MSHTAFTTAPPPGPETKLWKLGVGAGGGDMIKILANLHQSLRGKGKKGRRKRKSPALQVRSYELGKAFL